MKKKDKVCAVPYCGARIPGNKLMCLKHWNKISKPIQAKFRRIAKDGTEAEWVSVVREVIDIAKT